MQRWFMFLAACGVAGVLVNGAFAQIQIQIQAQPAQIQLLPVQGKAMVATSIYGGAPNRLSHSDAVFVGRVVAFEPMDIEAAPAKGQAKVSYRIAVIQLAETIFGVKKGTQTVRVGFVVAGNNGNNPPGAIGGIQVLPAVPGGLGRARIYGGAMNLTVGQDGLFFLAKHPAETFFLAPAYNNFVTRQENANFDNEVKSAKQISRVLENVSAALTGEDKQDRFTAAAVLVSRYRSNVNGLPMKQVPIDAAESKRILKAMAEGDWTVGRFNQSIPTPQELFTQLGITTNDGYKLVGVKNQQDIAQTMQKWLSENGDKYVIKKLVSDPNGTVVPPPAQPGVIRGGIQIQPLPAPKKDN